MRVLHVAQPVDGGVAAVVAGLTRHQRDSGHQVGVACPKDGTLSCVLTDAGVEVFPWEAVRSPARGLRSEYFRLRDITKSFNPEVVHLHSSKAGLVGRLVVRNRYTTVFQPHAWAPEAARGVMRWAATKWESNAAMWSAATICGSDAEASLGVDMRVKRLHTVANGVDLGHWNPADRRQARKRLGLPTQDPIAVCVGRLTEQKGQDLLLELWPGVSERVPRARLILVGDGPLEVRLRRMAADLPEVSFSGAALDPRDWFAAADVVVLPSRWEGAALVPLEAMAMERCVVGFNVGSLAERVGPQATAELRNLGDLQRLLTERLLDSGLAEAEGVKNLKRVAEHYDANQAYERITSLTEGLRPHSGGG